MYKNILVPIALDHRPTIKDALDAANLLLSDGGAITALNVREVTPSYVEQYLPEGHAEQAVKELSVMMKSELADAPHVKPVVISGHAAQSILDYANAHEIDCIVLASHDPGLQDYFLGSTAGRVVRHAHCAVHVVR